MEAQNKPNRSKLFRFPHSITAGASALLFFSTAAVYADSPYTMAPPVQPAYEQPAGDQSPDTANASADTVFNWNEVPQNQQVPIQRAVFDQGGYQLYDTAGETIVIPFTDNNLYVMKFAVSPDGTTFFVNDGDAPVLYLPEDGYLENGTVSGARWYPFSNDFHPADPVFVGCAPSWSVFIGMGWYPGMYCHGGFWCDTSFWDGGIFTPTIGLFFVIGGHPCYGWNGFVDYCNIHPGFVHVGFFHQNVYRWADQPHFGGHPFSGGHPWNGNSGFNGNSNHGSNGNTSHFGNGRPGFSGTGTSEGEGHGFNSQNGHSWNSASTTTHHVFQGATAGAGWAGNHDNTGNTDRGIGGTQHPTFQGSDNSGNRGEDNGGRVFRGAQGTTGGSSNWSDRSNSGSRTFGGGASSGQSDAAPAHVFGGGASSGGWAGRSSGGATFGGADRSSGPSFSGGDRSSGGPSFSGGDRTGGHDNGNSGRSNNDNSGGNGGGNGGGSNGGGGGHWGH